MSLGTRKTKTEGSGNVLRRRRTILAWGFALPFVVVFCVFMLIPLLSSMAMSFTDITSKDLRTPFNVNFVGLDQYIALFHDRRFLHALGVTGIFVLVGLPITMVIALAFAVALNKGSKHLNAFFRAVFYAPVVASVVAVSVVWRYILQKDGLLNSLLAVFGIAGPDWLHDTRYALPALMVMTIWRNMGTLMIIFLAGLQAIGTLKRLGAVVTAYDVRPASQGEVESLGAKFLDLGLDFSKGQGEGGYARALSAEEQAQQQAAVDEKAAGFDIIITTAKVPGRKPPVLLTAAGVKGLKRGAVIVDCAASDLGGNVEGSAVGEQVTEGGVKLIGAPYLASGVATTASNLLSRNVADILVHFVRDGKLGQDLTEELDDALVVAGRAAAPAAAADAEKSEK